jgi:hypothetical protein
VNVGHDAQHADRGHPAWRDDDLQRAADGLLRRAQAEPADRGDVEHRAELATGRGIGRRRIVARDVAREGAAGERRDPERREVVGIDVVGVKQPRVLGVTGDLDEQVVGIAVTRCRQPGADALDAGIRATSSIQVRRFRRTSSRMPCAMRRSCLANPRSTLAT